MNKFVRGLALGVLVVAAAGLVRAADDDAKAAQKDVLDVAKEIAGGGKVSKAKLEAIKKKYDELAPIMYAYKPRAKGGVGVGPMGKADGIEAKIIALGKKAPTKAQLEKEAEELVKVANINAAIAEITMLYTPKASAGKDPKDWKEYTELMAKSSAELAKAAKAGNPADVQKAANNLNNACNDCHSKFRD